MKRGYLRAERRIIALVLCIAMLFGICPYSGAESSAGVRISGYSLTVSESSLGINLYLSGLSGQEAAEAYVFMGDRKLTPETTGQGTCKVSFYTAPKDIDAVYTATLYMGGRKTAFANADTPEGGISVSVRQYLSAIKQQDNATGRLAQAIDDYGTCAAVYFNDSTTEPCTVREIEDISSFRAKETGTLPAGIRYYGSSLVLKENVSVRHYFVIEDNFYQQPAPAFEVLLDGEPIEYHMYDANRAYVEISDLPPGDMDKTFTLAVAGEERYELSYSVLSYVYEASGNRAEESLCQLVKSLYWYHEAFEACLQEQNSRDDEEHYKNSKYTENFGQAVILLPEIPTEEERYAAYIIQTAIQQLEGYKPEILSDTTAIGSTGRREIALGATNRPHDNPKEAPEGSYRIKSYDGGVAITGTGKRGVIDGAVYFLELCGGFYWLDYEDGLQTDQDCLKYASDIDYTYERAFEFTDVDLNYWKGVSGTNRLYSLSFGLNGTFANVQMDELPGSQSWYLSSYEEYGDIHNGLYRYMQPGHAHTLLAEYFDENDLKNHPDWFVDQGEVAWNQRQVCTSNPEVYARIKERVLSILRDESKYDSEAYMQIICLAQSDNGVICRCDDCKAFRKDHYIDYSDYQNNNPDEANAALYLDLCNRISADIKAEGERTGKDYSNVYVDMLAYISCKQPPANMTVDDHVIIRFAPIERCYAHSLKESADLDFSKAEDKINGCYECNEIALYLQGWAKLVKDNPGSKLWIWDYTVNFKDTYAPYPNIYAMIEDIRYYKELGVSGIYLQNSDRTDKLNTEYGDLRIYILSTLLRDPDADAEKELEFFLKEYYGDGGEYVGETLKVLTNQARKHNVGPDACYSGYEPWRGNYYFNNIAFRDKMLHFCAPVSQTFNNAYDEEMDPHNGMTEEDVARVDELFEQALSASADDVAAVRNIRRTQLGWRAVKSVMKVVEFSDSSTYLQENKQLYYDIFVEFGMRAFSLLYEGVPQNSDRVLQKTPDLWMTN